MTDATQPSAQAGRTGHQTLRRRQTWQTRVLRCRAWLRELSVRLTWMLVARHAARPMYCPVARSGLAVLLHGLDRDVALSHICAPVHSAWHASAAWDCGASLKRSPLLTR